MPVRVQNIQARTRKILREFEGKCINVAKEDASWYWSVSVNVRLMHV